MPQEVNDEQKEKSSPSMSPKNPHSHPVTNFVNMVIRYISDPVSQKIKNTADRNPTFKKYICLPPAHVYLWIEKQVNIRVYGQAPEKSAVYVEKKAVSLGANLLGEAFLFAVAATFLTLEYYRAKRRKLAKEYEKGIADTLMKKQIQEQTILAEQQEAEIRELRRNVYRLELLALKNETTQV